MYGSALTVARSRSFTIARKSVNRVPLGSVDGCKILAGGFEVSGRRLRAGKQQMHQPTGGIIDIDQRGTRRSQMSLWRVASLAVSRPRASGQKSAVSTPKSDI